MTSPADFDPNTMNKYDYPSTDMSTAYLMHVAADGSTIANVDLSVTDDGTDEEDGMGSNISSFDVDAAGNLYVTDYSYIYVLTPKGSSCSRSTTASTAAASAACSPIRSVSCGTTTPPTPRRAPTRTASSSSPSILRRRPGARRSRCRPTSERLSGRRRLRFLLQEQRQHLWLHLRERYEGQARRLDGLRCRHQQHV
ncbi:MAG: hypothetical protein ACLU3I_04595 [Acutalibacteraceae bacterium]